MRGGDLSNETPKRVAVTTDCIIRRVPVISKILGVIPYSHEEIEYDRVMLSRLWNYSAKSGYILELVGFGVKPEDMQDYMDDLDNLGTNPFNYAKAYYVVADLVAEMPYRNELVCVIDIPSRSLRYGSWYYDIGRV
jgi:hypothetical protein